MKHVAKLLVAATLGTLSLLPNIGASDTIVLMADEWCPYNCDPDSDSPGFMVEIVREALLPYGHEVDYKTLNWARSLHKAEAGEIDGVIGALADDAPGFILGPAIGTYEDAIAFRKGEEFEIGAILARSDLRLGVINGYEYFGIISSYINAHAADRSLVQYMSGDDALEKNLRKLVAGRVDMVAEGSSVIDYAVKELGIADQVESKRTDDPVDVFIGFSPSLPNSQLYADQLKEGVLRLRESGRYDEIMQKYGQASE